MSDPKIVKRIEKIRGKHKTELVQVGIAIAHAIRCNPIHFSRVSSYDYNEWVSQCFQNAGFDILPDQVDSLIDNSLSLEMPKVTESIREWFVHKR